MEIPALGEALLKLIEPQSLHCDKKSQEKATGIVKQKYKLLTAKKLAPLDFYLFFTITSKIGACQKSCTVCISKEDWENIVKGYLYADYSYLDFRKIEYLGREEVLEKINDRGNRFLKVARLSDKKFESIKQEYLKIKQKGYYLKTSSEVKQLIDTALLGANIETRILEQLGL